MSAELPIVDIASALGSARRTIGSEAVVLDIDYACRETGFFAVVGHGLETVLADAFASAAAFFALDQEAKERVPRTDRFGFVPQRDRAIDAGRIAGITEYLDLPIDQGADTWPEDVDFRSAVGRYREAVGAVADAILAAIAVALDQQPTFFADRMTAPPSKLRLLHYTPRPTDPDGRAMVTNEAHTDYGAITLLATDGVPGLELRPRGGDWQPVVAPPGALVVNLGDMLAVWTNLRYASTPHRVVASPDEHRYSIPYFVNPDNDTIVSPLASCAPPGETPAFAPLTAGAFLAGRIDGTIDEPFLNERREPQASNSVSERSERRGRRGREL